MAAISEGNMFREGEKAIREDIIEGDSFYLETDRAREEAGGHACTTFHSALLLQRVAPCLCLSRGNEQREEMQGDFGEEEEDGTELGALLLAAAEEVIAVN